MRLREAVASVWQAAILPPFSTLDDALDWLYGTQLTGTKLGLANMRCLAAALDLGEAPGNPPFRFLHVAGTNGKGSVCALLDSLLRAHGIDSGLFTSPHLVHFSERIRTGGQPMPGEALRRGLEELRERTAEWQPAPTFFELTTALALDHFRREGAEWIAWETGLGGRLDATNVVRPAACLITSLAIDHVEYLGPDLPGIAREKAGIIKAGVPVLTLEGQAPEALAVLRERAAEVGAPLEIVAEEWAGPLGLRGRHQRRHAALALAALRAAGFPLRGEAVAQGLAQARWPARFDLQEGGRIVLDGAHNRAAARHLAALWQEEFGDEPATVVFAAMRDKDLPGLVAELAPIAARFIATTARNPRAAAPGDLAALAAAFRPTEAAPSLVEALALARARPDRILICGSLFLAGEALALLGGSAAPRLSTQ